MYGIVSLLEGDAGDRLRAAWAHLDVRFGRGISSENSLPHLSWHVAGDYDVDAVRAALQPLAVEARPFEVRTAGLMLASLEFTGAGLGVVRTAAVSGLHARVWQAVEGLGSGVVERYDPERWSPGIALAGGEATFDALPELARMLRDGELPARIAIGNLALIEEAPGGHEPVFRLPFAGATASGPP